MTEGFLPRLSPDGKLIAFLRGGGDTGPGDSLYDLDLTGTRMPAQLTLFANTADYIHSYGWTGDSGQVVFDWQNGIYRVSGAGGSSTPIIAVSANDDCPDVNPVDGRIAFHDYLRALYTMDSGGAGRPPYPARPRATCFPAGLRTARG